VEQTEIAKSFGYHRAMDALGATIGPIVAFGLLPFIGYNYRILFVIAFLVGILSVGSFFFVKEIKKPFRKTDLKLDLKSLLANKRFVFFLVAIFVFGLGTLPITLMLLYPVSLAVSGHSVFLGSIPLIYFIYSGTFVLTAIPFGRLADKTSKRLVVILGFVMALVAYLGLAFAENFWEAAFFFAIFGLYGAATDGVERAMAARMVEERFLATAEGMWNAAVGFSSLLASLIGGLLWTSFGAAAAFLYGAAFSVIGLVIFIIFSLSK
jgi:MFS family permease